MTTEEIKDIVSPAWTRKNEKVTVEVDGINVVILPGSDINNDQVRDALRVQGLSKERANKRVFWGKMTCKNSTGAKVRAKRVRDGLHGRLQRNLDRQLGNIEPKKKIDHTKLASVELGDEF